MTVEPVGNKVLVRPEVKQDSGIIHNIKAPKPDTGEVISIGEEVEEVCVGDRIFFAKGAGLEVNVNGERLLVLKETDIAFVYGD
jgi:chaperonin GroES